MTSTFSNVVGFFEQLGIYDVILPFLLVFTLMYALLEKTKILGTEKIGDTTYTKKPLNSMISFVSAFFVIASSKAVAVINETIAYTFVLLLMAVLFLLVFGTFYGEKEDPLQALGKARWYIGGIFGMGIALVFMHAVGWLEPTWRYLNRHWDDNAIASIILIIVIIAIMFFITKEPKKRKEKKEED